MRSFFGFVLLVVVLVGAMAFVALPAAAPGLVSAIVRGTPPLAGQDVTVEASVGTVDLLRGRITRIDVEGQDVRTSTASAGRVTASIDGLSILDRSFRGLDGRMTGLLLVDPDGAAVEFDEARLAGDSAQLTATGSIPAAEAERVIGVRLAAAGIPIDGVSLVEGGITIAAQGQGIDARLVVGPNGVRLDAGSTFPAISVVSPAAFPGWRIVDVAVAASGIGITATLEGARLE